MHNKGKARRFVLKLSRALDWEAHDLMQQRSPAMSDPTPQSFIFKPEDCHAGRCAEDIWPGVFACHLAREAREATHAADVS